MIDNGIVADVVEVLNAKDDPKSLPCRAKGLVWTATGCCPRCGRHWTDILNTKDVKARGSNRTVPQHKERGKRVK